MNNKTSLLILLISMLVYPACEKDKPEKKFDVSVYVVRYDTMVWYFGIYVNDEVVLGATECGTGHPDAEQCVDFIDPFLVFGKSYNYSTTLKEGDEIQVMAGTNGNQSCNASLSTWIYVDGELAESDVDDGDDDETSCTYFSGCETTL